MKFFKEITDITNESLRKNEYEYDITKLMNENAYLKNYINVLHKTKTRDQSSDSTQNQLFLIKASYLASVSFFAIRLQRLNLISTYKGGTCTGENAIGAKSIFAYKRYKKTLKRTINA